MTDQRPRAKNWSLARRLTLSLSGSVLVASLVTFLLGGYFLERHAAEALVDLVREEMTETRAALLAVESPIDQLPATSRELTAHHPHTPIAWRLHDGRTGAVVAEAGATSLLAAHAVGPVATGSVVELARGFAGMADRIGDFTCVLAVDGRVPLRLVDRYWVTGGMLIAVSSLVALVLGHLLARGAARLLREVGDDARAASAPEGLASRAGAPDEIRAVVDALRAAMERIQGDSERLRVFAASLAHELRSPLQNLIAQAEVCMMRPRAREDYEAALVAQLDELRELGDAVDNLLAMCATRAAPTTPAGERFDLGVESRLRLQREVSRGSREGVDVRLEVAGDLSLCGDRESVLRGIRNVVANAIDCTPSGGRVAIAMRGEPDRVVVTVDDSGPGVPVDQRERICEPFVRGPAAARRRVGYGLGLAIARAAVVEHGGELVISTSPFGGARFELTLRRGTAPMAAANGSSLRHATARDG